MNFQLDETIPVEIQRTLVVSTGHVQLSDMQKLTNLEELKNLSQKATPELMVHNYDEGAFIMLINIEENMCEIINNFSKDMVNLILLAQKNGCSILQLDRDGPTYKQLPSYSW